MQMQNKWSCTGQNHESGEAIVRIENYDLLLQ
jgi:hypothetical protein